MSNDGSSVAEAEACVVLFISHPLFSILFSGVLAEGPRPDALCGWWSGSSVRAQAQERIKKKIKHHPPLGPSINATESDPGPYKRTQIIYLHLDRPPVRKDKETALAKLFYVQTQILDTFVKAFMVFVGRRRRKSALDCLCANVSQVSCSSVRPESRRWKMRPLEFCYWLRN